MISAARNGHVCILPHVGENYCVAVVETGSEQQSTGPADDFSRMIFTFTQTMQEKSKFSCCCA